MSNVSDWSPDTATEHARSADAWVFGYGSLVDPVDLGLYIGCVPTEEVDWFPSVLNGYERNWDVGMDNLHSRTDDKFFVDADGSRFDGVILSLGIAAANAQRINGVVFRVDSRLLPSLDKRERRYNRIDVTAHVVTPSSYVGESTIYTYAPKADAVARATKAIASRTAAVPRAYHDKVRAAFNQLGQAALCEYNTSTRAPNAPLADLAVVPPGTARHAEG